MTGSSRKLLPNMLDLKRLGGSGVIPPPVREVNLGESDEGGVHDRGGRDLDVSSFKLEPFLSKTEELVKEDASDEVAAVLATPDMVCAAACLKPRTVWLIVLRTEDCIG